MPATLQPQDVAFYMYIIYILYHPQGGCIASYQPLNCWLCIMQETYYKGIDFVFKVNKSSPTYIHCLVRCEKYRSIIYHTMFQFKLICNIIVAILLKYLVLKRLLFRQAASLIREFVTLNTYVLGQSFFQGHTFLYVFMCSVHLVSFGVTFFLRSRSL